MYMYMLFSNLIIIKLCILHKCHQPSCWDSTGICHSTGLQTHDKCLQLPNFVHVPISVKNF